MIPLITPPNNYFFDFQMGRENSIKHANWRITIPVSKNRKVDRITYENEERIFRAEKDDVDLIERGREFYNLMA